jgi:hypothetical protein
MTARSSSNIDVCFGSRLCENPLIAYIALSRLKRGSRMKRFIEGEDRLQGNLLPKCLDDYIGQDNPVRMDITPLPARQVHPNRS